MKSVFVAVVCLFVFPLPCFAKISNTFKNISVGKPLSCVIVDPNLSLKVKGQIRNTRQKGPFSSAEHLPFLGADYGGLVVNRNSLFVTQSVVTQ